MAGRASRPTVVGAVAVPAERWARWVENFASRHGATALAVGDGALRGTAEDGSTFAAHLPFATAYAGPADAGAFLAAVEVPTRWGVLLVRKGGFAVARLAGPVLAEHKIGQRHVQGRTKAGGQSQQRFARRRDNQARQAYEAAAEHAARILAGPALPVVTGGDHAAIDEVLADPRLRHVTVTAPWLAVPDPRRGVLDRAVADAQAVWVEVVNR
ncbi:MAG TPA: acVLRF1 family peptidyl-tRNA hydrolase [Nocardioides sp.]|nr:acVLRF1 family peptidyl-tRNA hydrolase [Nocardioides sp.]